MRTAIIMGSLVIASSINQTFMRDQALPAIAMLVFMVLWDVFEILANNAVGYRWK